MPAPSIFPFMPTPLLIDTDPGIDDAVAIALAAGLAELRVVAITTVHGNVEVERATRNAREVARLVGLEVPVVAGAPRSLARGAQPARETHGKEGLGRVRPRSRPAVQEHDEASEVIVRIAREIPGLSVCCLGPLTNLAHAIELDPALGSRLGPVYVMGGAFAVRGTQTHRGEFNWWSDPEAAAAVLDAALDLRLVPLDVTRRIAVPGSAIRALEAAGARDERAHFWADALGFYADFHRGYERLDGCIVNDALAVALAADLALATWSEAHIGVCLSDDEERGAVYESPDGLRVSVALDVRAESALELIRRHVFAEWLPSGSLAPGAAAAARWLRDHPVEPEE